MLNTFPTSIGPTHLVTRDLNEKCDNTRVVWPNFVILGLRICRRCRHATKMINHQSKTETISKLTVHLGQSVRSQSTLPHRPTKGKKLKTKKSEPARVAWNPFSTHFLISGRIIYFGIEENIFCSHRKLYPLFFISLLPNIVLG